MSDRDPRKKGVPRLPIPPGSRIPENTGGLAFFDIEEIHVGSWGPLPDGKGPQTQVHLTFRTRGSPPFVMRFKGPHTLGQLISMLERHRNDVWPGGDAQEPDPGPEGGGD